MNLEVNELQNFYTKTGLGFFCKKSIGNLIKKNKKLIVRENFNREIIVGYGYPIPYIKNLIKKNSEYLCLMPKNQGALSWPIKNNRTLLIEQNEWPLESEISDLVMIAHGLENSDNPNKLLEEAWRTLVPEGYLFIVVPNRTGFWARSDLTPFGFGRPYSILQLSKLLVENKFQIINTNASLFMPPTKTKFLFNSFKFIDQIAAKYASKVMGGVLVILAKKQIHLVNTVKISDSIKVPLEIFDGLIKPKPKPLPRISSLDLLKNQINLI